jgi:hypothetical protein
MDDYAQQFQEHSRLQRAFVSFFWGGLVFDVVALGLDYKIGFSANYDLTFRLAMIAAWAIPLIFQADKLISWPCPRCDEPFAGGSTLYRAKTFWNPLPLQCANCGLSKYPKSSDSNL